MAEVTRTYRVLRAITRAALQLYYREVEVHGLDTVPPEGPLLILANHHNGLVDPMLVVATIERQARFLAKAPLFDMPGLGWIMRGMRAVPVYRQQDPGYDKEKNVGVYAAVAEALAAGGAVGIFPEGKSHTDPWIAEFKHGAARMALEAEAAHDFELGLSVQLVGIQFERTRLFRGKVLVNWAPPCTIESYREAYRADPRPAVEALTASLHEALRAMVVEAEDDGMVRLAELVERFGVVPIGAGRDPERADPERADAEKADRGGDDLKGRFERRKWLLEGYRQLHARRPEEMGEVLIRLQRYRDLLRTIGVRDTHVEEDHLWTRGLLAALMRTAALVLGAPLALAGFALNALPYAGVLYGVVLQAKTSDVRASSGLLVATAVFPLWYLLLGLAGWWSPLPWTLWLPVLAAGPFLGLHTMRWRERWRELARATLNLWLAVRTPSVRRRLRAMRHDLLSRIEELVRDAEDPYAARADLS